MKSVALAKKKENCTFSGFCGQQCPVVFRLDFLHQRSFKILKTIRCLVTRRCVCYHIRPENTWCGRKVMRLATLCTNRQSCCLPLHMAVRLTPAVDSAQV